MLWVRCDLSHNWWNLARSLPNPNINIHWDFDTAWWNPPMDWPLTHIANTVIQKVHFEWTTIVLFHYIQIFFLIAFVNEARFSFRNKMNLKIYENSKISIFNETLISVFGTENGILCVTVWSVKFKYTAINCKLKLKPATFTSSRRKVNCHGGLSFKFWFLRSVVSVFCYRSAGYRGDFLFVFPFAGWSKRLIQNYVRWLRES